MRQRTINKLRKLAKKKKFSILYEETFGGARGPKSSIEVVVSEEQKDRHWTDRIPFSMFGEIRNEANTSGFIEAKEEVTKLAGDKYFKVGFEKTYYENGKKTIDCSLYVDGVGYFYSNSYASSLKQLIKSIEEQEEKDEEIQRQEAEAEAEAEARARWEAEQEAIWQAEQKAKKGG